jgi:carbon-monoxide dehydrogenase small subunit
MTLPAYEKAAVAVDVNGQVRHGDVEPRTLLVHFLRDELELTGTHVGCDTGNCGACSVIVDGRLVKSCMMLAVQADGARVETVEGPDPALERLREAFGEYHALQCGYCTPGMLMNARALLERNPSPSEEEIRCHLQGNLCRCTGYVNIVRAIAAAAEDGAAA